METIGEDEFDRVFNVNCKSVYLTAKQFVPHFKENKSGVILNIASTAGVSPRPNLNWYNSSKGWMILASKTMAVEHAPFGFRGNVVNPVAVETWLILISITILGWALVIPAVSKMGPKLVYWL